MLCQVVTTTRDVETSAIIHNRKKTKRMRRKRNRITHRVCASLGVEMKILGAWKLSSS